MGATPVFKVWEQEEDSSKEFGERVVRRSGEGKGEKCFFLFVLVISLNSKLDF